MEAWSPVKREREEKWDKRLPNMFINSALRVVRREVARHVVYGCFKCFGIERRLFF